MAKAKTETTKATKTKASVETAAAAVVEASVDKPTKTIVKKPRKQRIPTTPAGLKVKARKNRCRPTSYSMYLQAMHPKVHEAEPGLSFVEISQKIAGMWAALSPDEKNEYKELAEKRHLERKAAEPEGADDNEYVAPRRAKRPCTAYTIYLKEHWQENKNSNKDASFTDVSKIIAAQWKSMTDEQKAVYTKKSAEIAASVQTESSEPMEIDSEPAESVETSKPVETSKLESETAKKSNAGRKRKAEEQVNTESKPAAAKKAAAAEPKKTAAKESVAAKEPAAATKEQTTKRAKKSTATEPVESKPAAPATATKKSTSGLKLYAIDHKPEVKAKFPTYKVADINREVAKDWAALDKATKDKYEALAAKASAE